MTEDKKLNEKQLENVAGGAVSPHRYICTCGYISYYDHEPPKQCPLCKKEIVIEDSFAS